MNLNLNEIWEMLTWTVNAGLDLFLHFIYSGLAALLGFYLTWWAIRLTYFVLACLLRCPTSMSMGLARSMRRLGWCAALFASLTAHLWWDRLLAFS